MKSSFFNGIVSALLLNVFLVILVNKALSQKAQQVLHIRAQSAVLMDAISGQVLFEQDPQIRRAPATHNI
jgi:D-alanyl-D-alanine carboxypeptidase